MSKRSKSDLRVFMEAGWRDNGWLYGLFGRRTMAVLSVVALTAMLIVDRYDPLLVGLIACFWGVYLIVALTVYSLCDYWCSQDVPEPTLLTNEPPVYPPNNVFVYMDRRPEWSRLTTDQRAERVCVALMDPTLTTEQRTYLLDLQRRLDEVQQLEELYRAPAYHK